MSAADRIPPHDLAAERSVLGALLSDEFSLAWKEVERSGLSADDFYRTGHREIFRRIAFLAFRGTRPDPVTLSTAIAGPLRIEESEAMEILTDLHAGFYYAANVETYAERIRETATRRRLLERVSYVARLCYEQNGEDVSEILAGHLEDVRTIRETIRTKPFPTIRGNDFLLDPPPPRRLLVSKDVLGAGEWLFVFGEAKAGKSMLALDLACALVSDEPESSWCGFDVFAGGRRVLYCVGEGGRWSFYGRFSKRTKELSPEERNRLVLWFPTPELLDVSRSDEFARLRDAVIEGGFDVVILDPLINFHSCDENSNSEMRAVGARILELTAATGAAVVIVHHTRKATVTSRRGSPLEGRGATAMWGFADGAVVFDKEGENENDPERRMTFVLRNAEEEIEPRLVVLDRLSCRYEVVASSLGGRPATHEFDEAGLLRYLENEGASTYDEISDGTGIPKRSLSRWLPDLLRRGFVSRSRPHSRAPYRWSIAEPGAQQELPLERENR